MRYTICLVARSNPQAFRTDSLQEALFFKSLRTYTVYVWEWDADDKDYRHVRTL